jgi:hypothetical protein
VNDPPEDLPVDGFAIESTADWVRLTLSNRYGDIDTFQFDKQDALWLGVALIQHAEVEPEEAPTVTNWEP